MQLPQLPTRRGHGRKPLVGAVIDAADVEHLEVNAGGGDGNEPRIRQLHVLELDFGERAPTEATEHGVPHPGTAVDDERLERFGGCGRGDKRSKEAGVVEVFKAEPLEARNRVLITIIIATIKTQLLLDILEPLEGEVLEETAAREEGAQAPGREAAGRAGELAEGAAKEARSGLQSVVRDAVAALELELPQTCKGARDETEGSIVDARLLARALQREDGHGVEAGEHGREEKGEFRVGREHEPLPALGVDEVPPPADTGAGVPVLRPKLRHYRRQALVRERHGQVL